MFFVLDIFMASHSSHHFIKGFGFPAGATVWGQGLEVRAFWMQGLGMRVLGPLDGDGGVGC